MDFTPSGGSQGRKAHQDMLRHERSQHSHPRRTPPQTKNRDMTVQLNRATTVYKLDLSQGYHQLGLHPSSHVIITYATHSGLFRYICLNFGISSAAEMFQEAIR